jgi:hypothetical protein
MQWEPPTLFGASMGPRSDEISYMKETAQSRGLCRARLNGVFVIAKRGPSGRVGFYVDGIPRSRKFIRQEILLDSCKVPDTVLD